MLTTTISPEVLTDFHVSIDLKDVNRRLEESGVPIMVDSRFGIPNWDMQMRKKILFHDMAEWRPDSLVSDDVNPYLEPQDESSHHVTVRYTDGRNLASFRLTPAVCGKSILRRPPFDCEIIRSRYSNDINKVVEWTNLLPFFPYDAYAIDPTVARKEAIRSQLSLTGRKGAKTNLKYVLKAVAATAEAMGYDYIRTFTDKSYFDRYKLALNNEGVRILEDSIVYEGVIPSLQIDSRIDESIMYILEMPVTIAEHIELE